MRCLFSSLLVLSISFCATSVHALVIDNFVIGQGSLGADNSFPDVNGSGGTFTPGNILGLERDVRLQRTGVPVGNLPSTVSFFSTPYPYVQIVPGNSSNADVTFQWDGFADGTKNVLDPTGLVPVANLVGPGSNLISVTASNGASPTTAVFTIRDSADVITTNTLVIPPSFNGDLQFLFSAFDTPANFSQVEAMQLKLSVPLGTTFYLSGILQSEYIFFGTPEPSTISLLVPMLSAAVWRRRRRRKELPKAA